MENIKFNSGKKYVKDYIQAVGELHSTDYSIHHIDGNHENDRIENLVAIPNSIHIELHKQEKEFARYSKKYLKKPNEENKACVNYHMDMYRRMFLQIKPFILLRNELLKNKKK